MRIQDALPAELYSQALQRSQSPEWLQRRDEAIALLQQWQKDPDINHDLLPALWFGYGKDATAVFLLLRLAEVPFVTLNVDNGGDIQGHDRGFFAEFDAFAAPDAVIWYETEKPYIEILKELLEDGRSQSCEKEDGTPIDFFDLGEMEEYLSWEVLGRFFLQYSQKQEDVLYLWGNRADEEEDRQEELERRGKLHRSIFCDSDTYYRGTAIADWSTLDVWALLVAENAPVSPVYAMHDIPQQDDHPFPRTLWYPSSKLVTHTFLKWLHHYAPEQRILLLETFPEIQAAAVLWRSLEAAGVTT